MITMSVRILDEDAADDLREYMERIKKPKLIKVRDWIQRVRHLNFYLEAIADGQGGDFSHCKFNGICHAANVPLA